MDSGAGSKPGAGAGANKPSTTARRGAPRSSGPGKTNSRLHQNVVRHLGGDATQIPRASNADRMSANNTTLKVLGLKSSRAVANADGGIRSLLEFLEKKATNVKTTGSGPGRRVRPVVIKKVCQGIRSMRTGGLVVSPENHSRYPALSLADRAENRNSPTTASTLPVNPPQHSRFFDLANIPIVTLRG